MARREREYGEEVPPSFGKGFGQLTWGIGFTVVGVLTLVCAGIVFWNCHGMNVFLTLLLGGLIVLVGLVFLSAGLDDVRSAVAMVWRQDRLCIGKDRLLCVTRTGKILTCIPYDNIADVHLHEEMWHSDGVIIETVRITLIDDKREDTILLKESSVGQTRRASTSRPRSTSWRRCRTRIASRTASSRGRCGKR